MPENISLSLKQQKKFTSQTEHVKKKVKTGKIKVNQKSNENRKLNRRTGIVLLTHIPHGFYEEELEQYFSQFGKILHVKLCRSRKTGKSKGSAFIHFENDTVAKIAVESMDNYLMYKKRIVAKFLTPKRAPSNIFKLNPINEDNLPLERVRAAQNKKKNAYVPEKRYQRKCIRKLIKIKKISRKISELGIDLKINTNEIPSFVENDKLKANIESNDTPKKVESPLKTKRKKSTRKTRVSKSSISSTVSANKLKKATSPKHSPKIAKIIKLEKSKGSMKSVEDKVEKKETNKLKKSTSPKRSPKVIKSIKSKKTESSIKSVEGKAGKKKSTSSLVSIKKAKTKITTEKRDVKKLKSAMRDYLNNNFGKSKPILRSATNKNKSK